MVNLDNELYLLYNEWKEILQGWNPEKEKIIDPYIYEYFRLTEKYNINDPNKFIDFINSCDGSSNAKQLFLDIHSRVKNILNDFK